MLFSILSTDWVSDGSINLEPPAALRTVLLVDPSQQSQLTEFITISLVAVRSCWPYLTYPITWLAARTNATHFS